MNIFKIIIIVFLFTSGLLYSQKDINQNSKKTGKPEIGLKLKGTVLPGSEFKTPKLILPFLFKNNSIFPNPNTFLYQNFPQTLKRQSDLAFAKNNISKFLLLKYSGIPNYDLGKFGEYLGISKNIFTIILAIISML